MTQDVLERIRRYAPTPASLAGEWTIAHDDEVLARITRDGADADVVPLHFVPARPTQWRRMLPVAASAAVLAVAAGGLIVLLPGAGDDGPGGRVTGAPFNPPPGLSAKPDVTGAQVGYRLRQYFEVDQDGRAGQVQNSREWIRPNGSAVRNPGPPRACHWSHGPGGKALFDWPTAAFYAAMPTEVSALNGYLRSRVRGSSSRDEAMFVNVSDTLREADVLASPRLRAAMVAVLSRTPGITLQPDAVDYLGRPALRLDFVDQRIRPGEVQSLYVDPATFRFLEEREGRAANLALRWPGPSPAYDAHGQIGKAPQQLTGAASITLARTTTVLPKAPHTC